MNTPSTGPSPASPPPERSKSGWHDWIQSTGAAVGIVSGLVVIGGLVAAYFAGLFGIGQAGYDPAPETPEQVAESFVAVLSGGGAEDLLGLFHRPTREACTPADAQRIIEDAAVIDDAPPPQVRLADTSSVTFEYDAVDEPGRSVRLDLVEEDGVLRIVSHLCADDWTEQQWFEAYGNQVIATAAQAAMTIVDVIQQPSPSRNDLPLACGRASQSMTGLMQTVRADTTAGRVVDAPSTVRPVLGPYLDAVVALATSCTDQALALFRGDGDISAELAALESATAAMVQAGYLTGG